MEKVKKVKEKSAKAKGYVVAGVIAITLALGIWGMLIFVENSVMSKYDTEEYLAFNADLGKGTQIKDLSVFTILNVGKDVVPENTITDYGSLIGKYLLCDVSSKTICTENLFGELPPKDENSRTLSLKVEDVSQAVNGMLRASDKVDLYLVPTSYKEETESSEVDGNEKKKVIFEELQKTYPSLTLDAVYDTDGFEIPNDDNTRLAIAFDITVNDKDADKIISMIALGYRIWIDKVNGVG